MAVHTPASVVSAAAKSRSEPRAPKTRRQPDVQHRGHGRLRVCQRWVHDAQVRGREGQAAVEDEDQGGGPGHGTEGGALVAGGEDLLAVPRRRDVREAGEGHERQDEPERQGRVRPLPHGIDPELRGVEDTGESARARAGPRARGQEHGHQHQGQHEADHVASDHGDESPGQRHGQDDEREDPARDGGGDRRDEGPEQQPKRLHIGGAEAHHRRQQEHRGHATQARGVAGCEQLGHRQAVEPLPRARDGEGVEQETDEEDRRQGQGHRAGTIACGAEGQQRARVELRHDERGHEREQRQPALSDQEVLVAVGTVGRAAQQQHEYGDESEGIEDSRHVGHSAK